MHDYAVLGPLLVDGRADAAPRRPAQRRLLALLLLAPGQVVHRTVLIERLWPSGPPERSINALQAHVSGLRRQLGVAAVSRHHDGYALEVVPEAVDADGFRRLVEQARRHREAGAPGAAAASCEAALALWRGTPYPELRHDPFAAPSVDRLVDLEVEARSLRATIAIDLGRPDVAVAELRAVLLARPHEERAWALLMLAHHRAGRRAAALAVLEEARRSLARVGLAPGRLLRWLGPRIRDDDPRLAGSSSELLPARPRGVGP